MPGKPITVEAIEQDLRYVAFPTTCAAALYRARTPLVGLRMLEAGCGSGKLGMGYALRGAEVTLLDFDRAVLDYTLTLWDHVVENLFPPAGQRVHFHLGSVQGLPFHDESFDFVFNEGVPQHWHDVRKRQTAISEMVRVTVRGGTVAVVGTNPRCPEMQEWVAQTKYGYLGMDETEEPFTPAELCERMKNTGLLAVQVEPAEPAGGWELSKLLIGWGKKP